MDLSKYMWLNKLTPHVVAADTGMSAPSVSTIRERLVTPRLWTAFKISHYTGGQVTFEEMLSLTDLMKLEKIKRSQLLESGDDPDLAESVYFGLTDFMKAKIHQMKTAEETREKQA